MLFLDGNTYSTDFSMFTDPLPNTVYTAHDYALPGFVDGGSYPGVSRGQQVDRAAVERTFLERTSYMRDTGTPFWIGEFGPVYTVGRCFAGLTAERAEALADSFSFEQSVRRDRLAGTLRDDLGS